MKRISALIEVETIFLETSWRSLSAEEISYDFKEKFRLPLECFASGQCFFLANSFRDGF